MFQKVFIPIFVGLMILGSFSCTRKTKTPEPFCICPLILAPIAADHFNFKLIDKTNGQDLVFGSGAKLTLSQIKAFLMFRGQSDSLSIQSDTAQKLLSFYVFPNSLISSSPPIDSVSLMINGYSPDQILFYYSKTSGCCPKTSLSSISLDGTQICMPCNGFIANIKK